MKFSTSNPARRRSRPGMAIVVVISLITLLTLLVLAFLLTSTSNRAITSIDTATRQADSIASLAKETLVSDILGEMRAGSAAIATTPDGKTSFTVENPKAMLPDRAVKSSILTDPAFARIVKQSAAGVPFHKLTGGGPAGTTRASDISTADPSLEDRTIAPSRWNTPRLLDPTLTLNPSQVPDWIYVARDGSNPTALAASNRTSTDTNGEPNPDFVVGRFAYQVYDVSGLLDASVAGYGSGTPANDIALKGSLLWADLTTLPGATTAISKLPDWRHPSGFTNTQTDLIEPWVEPYGWTRVPIIAGKSDNTFLGRSDLLAYQKANPTVLPEEVLPYLATSLRGLGQPSWSPTLDAGGKFNYRGDRDKTSAANRRVLGVRVGSDFTRRDGSTAKTGEPLMKNRFPLFRLRAFTNQNDAEIEKYFGLTRVGGAGSTTWQYRGTTNPDILTLEDIAAENREPDFFETLKIGLLDGSIGNDMDQNGYFPDKARDSDVDYQILRIGASIIDQWDSDDDPTIIQYGFTNPLTGVRVDDVAGVENLPYFHFLGESRFRRRDTGAPPNDSIAATFITFQLWNPHKNAADGKIAGGEYRIAFAGKSFMRWNTNSGNNEPGYTPYSRNSPVRTATFNDDYIEFSPGSGATSFSQPIYLKPGVAGAKSSKAIDTVSGTAPVIGYNVGQITAPYTSNGQHATRYKTNGMFSNYDPSMTFALQKKVNGDWVNYQIIPEWSLTHGFVIGSLIPNTDELYKAKGDYVNLHAMFIDPRTTRYGLSTTTQGVQAINQTTGNRTYDNKFFPPSNWTRPGGRRPEQSEANASSGSPTIIRDRDNKRRPADAGKPFTSPSQRPEILNRPFHSVADMGLAFRDDPWTSINFFGDPEDTENPGDGALLDLFSMTESPLREGVVNPNAAPVAVLETLLNQAAIREGTPLDTAQAKTYAQAIRTRLDAEPLLNPGEIAKLAGFVTDANPIPGMSNHKDRQVIARALADTANVRTWNLFLDVIAQSGKLSPSANGLDRFINEAERRYWYHLAIDRFTGEIVSLRQESISE